MTQQQTEVDQQTELLRLTKRTAEAAETIRLLLSLWTIAAVLGLFVWLILANAS